MKDIFCGKCNSVTPHMGKIVKGEFVFTCQTGPCDGFQKFPRTSDVAELNAWIDQHNAENKPAQSPGAEELDAAMLKVLEGI